MFVFAFTGVDMVLRTSVNTGEGNKVLNHKTTTFIMGFYSQGRGAFLQLRLQL
jgi:hypothetical protein